MTFDPDPEAERGQVRLFSGHETLVAEFSHAFVRVNPATYAAHVSTAALREITVDHRDLRDAQEWFDEVAGLSYTVDLSELSDRRWWLNPSVGDFLAEVRTRRHGMLTYAQFANKPEDITLFQRQPTYRVIALYSSTRQRTKLGRYFRDADTVPYDILHYDIRASFEPRGASQESLLAPLRLRGCWIDGSTRLKVRVTGANIRTMVFRLSNDLEVRSVTSEELGTLPFLRIAGQNHVLVTLPTEAPIGTEFTIGVSYAGLLPGQEPGENWIIRTRDPFDTQNPLVAKTVFRGTHRAGPHTPLATSPTRSGIRAACEAPRRHTMPSAPAAGKCGIGAGWAYFSQPILEGYRSLFSPAPSPLVPRQWAQSANSLGKWHARQDSNGIRQG